MSSLCFVSILCFAFLFIVSVFGQSSEVKCSAVKGGKLVLTVKGIYGW